MFNLDMVFSIVLVASFVSHQVAANWDPSTGYVREFKPKDEWLAANKPKQVTKEIQVAECAINTRLAFPDVQLFAWFFVNHTEDRYHGCPYGDCHAYTVFPQPEDLKPDCTNSHVFFWHDTGGVNGNATNPIANPQTGGFGYESSLDGIYHDGKPDTHTEQLGHDTNYPGFDAESLPAWSQEARHQYATLMGSNMPKQPKCGRPDEENKDPGSVTGAFGNYKPAPASDYQCPKEYVPPSGYVKPPPADSPTQPGNSPKIPKQKKPKHHGHQGKIQISRARCDHFCSCIARCHQDDACSTTCQTKHPSRDPQSCPQSVSLTKRHPHRSLHR